MKKLILLAVCFGFMTAVSYAQKSATKSTKITKMSKNTKKYCCPKCDTCMDKPGQCPKCKVALIEVGHYYCPMDGDCGTKPGKCPKCGMKTKKMTCKKMKM